MYNWVIDILRKLFTGGDVPTQYIPKKLDDVIVFGKSKQQRAYETKKAEEEERLRQRKENYENRNLANRLKRHIILLEKMADEALLFIAATSHGSCHGRCICF